MVFRMIVATFFTFGILFSLLVMVLLISAWEAGWLTSATILILTVVFSLIGWLVSPFFTDLFQGWIYTIRKLTFEQFSKEFPEVAAFVARVCEKYRMPIPRMRIVEDNNPTAYTYGTLPFNARIVVSRGIFHYLDVEEQCAVIAHELGHIKHLDFAIMTLAATCLQVLYEIGHVFLRTRDRDNPLPIIGLFALLCAWIGSYVLLYLSRAREYLADGFSAKVMGDPAPLQRALVKIAYGLAEQAQAGASMRLLVATRALGISDYKSANMVANAWRTSQLGAVEGNLALNTVPATRAPSFDARRVEPVLRFDLFNPWARVAELGSTHPLTGRRLKALNEQAFRLGRKPLFDFAAVDHEGRALDRVRLYGKFFLEVLVYFSPWIGLGLGFLVLAISGALPGLIPFFPAPILGLGLGMALKGLYRYVSFGRFEPVTMYELMCDPYASPLRGRPVELRGRIIGKAQAGALFGEDLAMQDVSGGIVNLNYESWFPVLGNLYFGLGKGRKALGQDVRARGWFRRSVFQFVDLADLEVEGERYGSWTRFWGLAWGWVVLGLGVLALVGWGLLVVG